MAASEHLSPKLFHGTGGAIKGGVVNPNEGVYGFGAYAADSEHVAASYAEYRAQEQGRLFGTVYRVKPISQRQDLLVLAHGVTRDEQGLQVVEPVSHPLNPDVDQGLVPGKKTYK